MRTWDKLHRHHWSAVERGCRSQYPARAHTLRFPHNADSKRRHGSGSGSELSVRTDWLFYGWSELKLREAKLSILDVDSKTQYNFLIVPDQSGQILHHLQKQQYFSRLPPTLYAGTSCGIHILPAQNCPNDVHQSQTQPDQQDLLSKIHRAPTCDDLHVLAEKCSINGQKNPRR